MKQPALVFLVFVVSTNAMPTTLDTSPQLITQVEFISSGNGGRTRKPVLSPMPHTFPNQLTRKDDPTFRETSPNNGLNDFVEQVNLVIQQGQTTYVDPRGPITTMGPIIGMSPAEILQARTTDWLCGMPRQDK